MWLAIVLDCGVKKITVISKIRTPLMDRSEQMPPGEEKKVPSAAPEQNVHVALLSEPFSFYCSRQTSDTQKVK